MNIVLVGYGRMGRLIEDICHQRGHTVIARVDATGEGQATELSPRILSDADGAIEFALAEGILDRINIYAESGVPTVVGTTGWDHLKDQAKTIVEASSGSLLQGSNFSLGAHLFFRLSAKAAEFINAVDEYDAAILEYHHNKKADYPSGTALTAAQGVLSALDRKTEILTDLPDGPIPPEALHVASVRLGSIPGIHELRLDSPADTLTISHNARHRGGFALGAVRGLEWLMGHGGYRDATEFIDDLLTGVQ